MHHHNLLGKRVLITHADRFMGPELCRVFAEHGATVIADTDPLREREAPAAAVAAAGHLDILVVNLAIAAPTTAAPAVSEQEWDDTFAALVHPLPRLCRAALPAMLERRAGKILLMGSASALRGMLSNFADSHDRLCCPGMVASAQSNRWQAGAPVLRFLWTGTLPTRCRCRPDSPFQQ